MFGGDDRPTAWRALLRHARACHQRKHNAAFPSTSAPHSSNISRSAPARTLPFQHLLQQRKYAPDLLNAPVARPYGVADCEPAAAAFVDKERTLLRQGQSRYVSAYSAHSDSIQHLEYLW